MGSILDPKPLTPAAANAAYIQGTSVNAKGDAVVLTNATMAAGSAVLTSAGASFTGSDVGKLIYVTNAGGPWTPLKATIASVQSSSQITLSTTAIADSWVIGGPNANCVYGTDNTDAFNAAIAAASASVLPVSDSNSRYRKRKPVIIPDGNYLIGQPLAPLAVPGISIFGAGRKATTLMFCEAGALISCDTYTATPTDAYNPGLAPGLNVSDLTFSSPVFIPTSLEGNRVSTAIQDNGCGDVYLRSVIFNGFKYGFNGAYGSDFTTVDSNVYFANCDVGTYFGVGSQQIKLNGPDWYKCREGLVFEGAPHFILSGGSFEDPLISAITFDGKASGVTRSGVPVNLSGASYDGSWSIYGTWFESNAGGSGRLAPRMIWINGDPPTAANFTGPAIRDCVLVAGGTQVGAGTASFLEMGSQYVSGVVIDRLKIRGNFINYVQNNSSGSATSDTKIINTSIPAGSGINYFRGAAGSGVTDDGGIYTSGGRTFGARFSGAIPLTLSGFGSAGGGTGWLLKTRSDSSSTAISGITQAGALVGSTATTTLSANGAVTIDGSLANFFTVTLQANATSSSITNAFKGQSLTIAWKQDATGGRSYVWPTNCVFANGAAPTDTTAGKTTSATFVYDGTNWVETGRSSGGPISSARNSVTGWYHVNSFGAKGDGTTNDTAAITSASNAGGAGATLYFPAGTYVMDGCNVTAAGQTWITHPEAVLKLKDSSSTFYILKLQNVIGFTLTGIGGSGGTLEGNKANNTSGNMFQMNGVSNFRIRGMTIQNANNWALSLGGCTDGVITENRFLNCNGGVGQAFYHGTYGACSNIEFDRNLVDMRGIALGNANTGGFTSYGNATTPNTNMRLNNNRVFVNKDTVPTNTGCLGMINTVGGQINSNLCVGAGIGITVATNSKWIAVNGNQVRGFFDFGIEFADSQFCGGSGNVVDGTGCNSYPVSISGTAKSINLTGGELYSNTTGKSCINISNTPTDITLSGVDMTLNGTGTVACVVLNGTQGVSITGGTMNGSTTADAGVKLIGSTGGLVSTGVRYKDFVTAGVRIDAVSAVTTDKVIINACIKVGTTPVHHVVTGSATLGSNTSITGNV